MIKYNNNINAQYVLLYIPSKILIINHNSSAAYVNKVKFSSVSSYTILIGIKQYIKQSFDTVLIPTIVIYNTYNILVTDII